VAEREDVAEAVLPGAGGVVVLSSEYQRAPDHPPEIVSPLQSEFAWYLRVVEGDRRKEVKRCEIRSWTGEFDGVFPAPDASVAAVRWDDQTEAGLVLVDLGEPRQLESTWDTRQTNWLEGPVWTPDSRLLVLVENPPGAGPWWAEHEPGEADDDDVSPGGTFSPGSIVMLDRGLEEVARRRIDVDLPGGWFPAGDRDRGLGTPTLRDGKHVVVSVPLEGELPFALPKV
jgi:hypothetical protein